MRIRRHAPDHVTGIDVFEIYLHTCPLKITLDGVPQEDAYVAVLDVPGRVAFSGFFHKVLTRPFRCDDHRMAPPLNALPQGAKKSIEAEMHLGNQAEVHVAVYEDRIGSDEPESRPINFTSPMLLRAASASVFAA